MLVCNKMQMYNDGLFLEGFENFPQQETPEIPYLIKGMKVMIVDDNEMNVTLLEEMLSETGLEIKSFTNPFNAADAVSKEAFDLFLLDIMMLGV